jgi:hypothetical protein
VFQTQAFVGGIMIGLGGLLVLAATVFGWLDRSHIYSAPVRRDGSDTQRAADQRGQTTMHRFAIESRRVRWVGVVIVIVGVLVAFV